MIKAMQRYDRATLCVIRILYYQFMGDSPGVGVFL